MNLLSDDKIIARILSFVDDKTFYECSLVSKKWNAVTKNNGFLEVHMPDKNSINELSRTRIRWLWLSSDRDYIGNCDFPKPRYPDSIRFLRLFGSISLQNWNILVQNFVNLRQLELGWLNLEIIGSESAWSEFPKLRILKLAGPELHAIEDDDSGLLDTRKMNNHTGLIAALQKLKFPKLRNLDVEGLFFESSSNIFVDSLLNFLIAHQGTLEKIYIVLSWDTSVDRIEWDRRTGSEDWQVIPNFDERLSKLKLYLDLFFFHFGPSTSSQALSRLVERITTDQPRISSSVVLWPQHLPAFNSNLITRQICRQLTSMALSMQIDDALDCKVFEKCTALKMLLINAQPKTRQEYETENYGGEPAQSQLINLKKLPKTLEMIQMINFFIKTTKLKHFTSAEEFPNLAVLNLQGIGEKDDLGFTIEMLAILASTRLFEVGIYRGFNRRALAKSCGSKNGAKAFMALTLLQEEDYYDGSIESLSVYYYRNDDGDWEQEIGICPRQVLREELGHSRRVMFTVDPECGDFFRTFQA